ncbi:uncharacterized protein sas isoform X7 [Macrobrachium rosenbergii]|uniref:uncharacterized protein sas isoform X7 n=1 Tax=Macrobrachium rosenbergii TaxID=79674 RepID=UPI0034D3EA64
MSRAHRLWALGAALVLLNLCPSLVGAQLGIDSQNASGEPCECSPSCEGDVGGSSGTGCHGRIVPREDCPCCKVCAQGFGSPCAPPALPCDSQFGIVCSAESICEAALVCQSDNDCPDDHFCLGTACVDPCPILTPCEGAIQGGECFTKGHVAQCRCPEGTIKNSAGTNCIPNNGTTEGCQFEGRLYAVGEVRYNGDCQEQCRCGTGGQFVCGPVSCPTGLFLTGQHSKDELCIELRNRPETDECCVVVVCANNSTHPSLLISPGSHRLGPISGEKDSPLHGNAPPLSGRSVSQERAKPITEEEYQKRLKDLEHELNKDQSEKKATGSKLNSNHTEIEKEHPKVTESDDSVQKGVLPEDEVTVTEEPQVETSTHLNDISEQATTVLPDVEQEDELFTTMMPDVQQDDEEAATETPIPAVVVELNEQGHEVHKITVGEAIEVVTQPVGEVESTTLGAEMEETTTQPQTEEMTTELTPVEEEVGFVSAREGKMAPEDTILTNESSSGTMKEKDGVTAGGLKVLAVTHNSSTLVLPSTKGGDVYYKSSDGTEWQRASVEAGQDSFVLKGLQPKTEYTLKWSGESSGSAKMTIKTEDGCIVESVSYGVGQDWAIGCDQRCSCRPGGKTSCQPRCLFLPGAVQDPLCTEVPYPEDPDCCVTYECKKEDANPVILDDKRTPGQPKLLVTGETHNSVTLAWDDFRAKTHEGGYVVEYREEKEVGSAGPETPWMRKELPTGQIPKHTVDNLKPNTIYEVRVSIYDETDDSRPGESTETLTVRTQPGCLYNNESYVAGEFFIGCEKRCMCLVSGDVKCFERCSVPYFRVNSFKDDPLCREVPEEGDECCVIVQCASGDSTVTEVENGTSITNMTNDNCSQTVCGANAVCVSHTMNVDILNLSDDTPLVFGRCQCLDGFISKPSDPNSCIPDPTRNIKEGVCTFKSNTYQPGEVFYNECEYRCSCNNNTEIECEPRCEFTHKNGSKVEPGCEYKPDPEDSCCMLRVCNSTSESAGDAGRSPSLISDGCTVDNVTYAKDEKFYKGCQTQCVCMGFGDVSCFSRCPPLKVLVSDTAKHCQTLPDPEDSCCSITVCDEETPDVMKANITEMEKEMIMMKERMKNTTEMEKEMLMKRMTELEREMLMENISQLETVLRNMIEEKGVLINSNISDSEKEMLIKNMLEIEMMMKDVVEMEKDITTRNLTDEEKESLKSKLTAMQRNLTDELLSEGKNDIDEHTRLHLLGIEHSHDIDEKKNNTHTHDDGTTHGHHDGHLPHTHDDKNNTHTHEDGITHTHPDGHLPHTHDEMNVTHTHEDGTTHTHSGGNLPHTHDETNVTHTHEDGITHTHPGGNLPHTHDDDETNVTHTHEDGTTHTHPGGNLPHTHDETNVTHTHEDGTTHTHPGGNLPHTHDDDEMNITHTHEDGTTHTHPGGHLSHTHDDTNVTHTHEDGITHTHPGGHLPHTHDDMNITHTHEDGTTHTHPGGHLPHTHDDMNITHTHEDGTTHTHPSGHFPHTHDDMNHTHTHPDMNDVDGLHSHSHTHGDDSHSHDHMDGSHNETHHMHEDGAVHMHHNTPGWKNETHHMREDGEVHTHHNMTGWENDTHHVHEDGEVHMHHNMLGGKNETHHIHEDGEVHMHHNMPGWENDTHHMHEDGEVHVHHNTSGWENDTHHVHEDGEVHMHHTMPGWKNETHHMHEDGAVHLHHNMPGWENDTHHMHEDGEVHMHHNMSGRENKTHHMHEDGEVHMHHNMPGWKNETHHMHEDGAVHLHHDTAGEDNETDHTSHVDEVHGRTAFGSLEKKNRAEDLGTFDLSILRVEPINSTSVVIRVGVSESVLSQILINENQHLKVLYSPDSQTWMEKNISVSDIKVENMDEILLQVSDLEPSTPYQFRISYRDHVSSTSKARLLDASSDSDDFQAGIHIDHSEMCSYNGRYYKRGQEFYEGCSQSCICSSNLEVHCAAIECPVTFGLQLYDPDCVEWDLDKDYTPTPPMCCPQVKCIQTSACEYMGQKFTNFDTIPRELTGCSQKCSCTYGNVTCIDECPPISDTPPSELNCAPEDAIRVTLPGETCCETWQCAAQSVNGTPIEFPLPPESVHPQGFDNEVDLIPRPHVTSLDATTAQVMFATPNHYQGLPGELLVRYTSDPARQPNPEDWAREIIVPAGSTISQSKWDYILNDLKPSTQYAMQVMLTIMGADPIMSPVFSYNSPGGASTPPTTTPLARLDIDAQLYVSEITKTSAKVSWRIFNQEELKYIDGVQLKYIAKGKLIPKFSQMFHRNNDQMDLRDLQPGTEYTVDLVFITHKNQSTEVSNTKPYVFETLPEEDKYAFDIVITAGNVTSQTAEIFYSGVSELEEKLVHVYKAVYLREEGNIQSEAFKIPKADEERKIFLSELKPDVEYEVWLDAYLTNGRKKKSNVITIKTKAGQLPKPERSEVDPALSDKQIHYSYYPALVAVAIIAAIACVGFLGLLVILLRKQNHAKAHINSSRNNAAYDNPSYKGYDMEMNGIKGSGNGATHMEDP